MSWRKVLLWTAIPRVFVSASRDLGFKDDSDLTSFVSRPDIKAPILDVKVYHEESVEPGYFFLAPYATIHQLFFPPSYYQTCQTGPTIYDHRGVSDNMIRGQTNRADRSNKELVWTGACTVRNQNACDFRAHQSANGTSLLSAILYIYGDDVKGHGVVMDNTYNIVDEVHVPHEMLNMNMHELNFIENGTRALHVLYRPDYVDITELNLGRPAGWVANLGFRELNIETGKIVFEWWALDHIDLSESTVKVDNTIFGPFPKAWNWLHINSVDKNADGDYIMSARFTDAVYKISGRDGSVIWRLGGVDSSFNLEGFNFSRQHDARWIDYNDEIEIISLLDNAADDLTTGSETSTVSSALIVKLDKTTNPMTAKVLKRVTRPDNQLSRLRGNAQNLPGGNTFIGWSDNAYITEYTPDGRMAMEAQFLSKRFVTYRSYKFPFIGNPLEPPDLKAFAYGTAPSTMTTVLYVSWNGATEVAWWKFYSSDASEDSPRAIGSVQRSGFETVYQYTGLATSVYAEAIAADGSVLGRSDDCVVVGPPGSASAVDGKLVEASKNKSSDNSGSSAPGWEDIDHRLRLDIPLKTEL